MIKNCFCGNNVSFQQCCEPVIQRKVDASNAQALMRSRFTAYVIEDYQYVLQTYASQQRTELTAEDLAYSAQGIQWLSLQVISHQSQTNSAQVEFKAYYRVENRYYLMQELSDFVLESGKWRYTTGIMRKSSGEFYPERNSQCLCASGKKFKKCCGI